MYRIPEERRVTADNAKNWEYISKQILNTITEHGSREDGFFWVPRVNSDGKVFRSSAKFLCRLVLLEGWVMLGMLVPTEPRSVTQEEIHWIKKFFFDPDDITISIQPGKSTYLMDNTFWSYVFMPEKGWHPEALPPIHGIRAPLIREAPFFTVLWRLLKKGVKDMFK